MPSHAVGSPPNPGRRPEVQNTPGDPQAPLPDSETLRLVQLSCQRLFAHQALMVEQFTTMLHDLVPEVRRLTPHDEQHLAEAVVQSVLWSALTRKPGPEIEQALERLGGDNHRQGFPEDGYLGLGHALLRAVRVISDTGWTSELSSAWVAYYSWLALHLRAGAAAAAARGAPAAAGPAGAGPAGAGPAGAGPAGAGPAGAASSLTEVLAGLRTEHFPDDVRGLESICTRVMLRTGADLRAPRPDQNADPAVISEVLTVLTIMGYAPPVAPAPAPAATVPGPAHRAPPPAGGVAGGPEPGRSEAIHRPSRRLLRRLFHRREAR